jgi:hypothetical protein
MAILSVMEILVAIAENVNRICLFDFCLPMCYYTAVLIVGAFPLPAVRLYVFIVFIRLLLEHGVSISTPVKTCIQVHLHPGLLAA